MIPTSLWVSYARAEWSLGPHIRPHGVFLTPNTMLNRRIPMHPSIHSTIHLPISVHPSIHPLPTSTSDQAWEKCWWESSEQNRPCPSHLEGHVSGEDRHVQEDSEWRGPVGPRGEQRRKTKAAFSQEHLRVSWRGSHSLAPAPLTPALCCRTSSHYITSWSTKLVNHSVVKLRDAIPLSGLSNNAHRI